MPTQACAVDSTKLFPNQKTSGTTKPFCVCGWRRRSLTIGLRATLFVSVVALAGELLLIYYWPIRQVQL